MLWTELGGSSQDLNSANLAIGATWHDYTIDAVGMTITVTVDGGVVHSHIPTTVRLRCMARLPWKLSITMGAFG